MKKLSIVVLMLAILAVVGFGQNADLLFNTNKSLAPAKACTSGVKNYSGYSVNTMQLAAKGHNGDTVIINLNQFSNNFDGLSGYTIAGNGADTLVFVDTLYLTDTLWNYGEVKTVTLITATNAKFKAWNKHTHDTTNNFNIGVGHR